MARPLSDGERRRYARHLALPEFGQAGQERLADASVLVVGLGGLGSPAALYLAAAGVGRIGLVDDDRVEANNLQRQIIHCEDTIGVLKVDSAAARLQGLNPHLMVERHPVRLTAANAEAIVSRYDVVLDGTDNFPARYLVNDVCVKLGKPNVFAGVLRFDGQLSVFDPKNGGPCFRCVFPEPPPQELAPNCSEAGVLGVLPGIMGAMQAGEAIKILAAIGAPALGRLILFDGLDLGFAEAEVARRDDCACCAHPEAIVLQDLAANCAATPYRNVTPAQIKGSLQGGAPLTILDVRDPEEFACGALAGAVLFPRPELEAALAEPGIPDPRLQMLAHGGDIMVVCRSGGRSQAAIRVLMAAGWPASRFVNLDGGLTAWKRDVEPGLTVA